MSSAVRKIMGLLFFLLGYGQNNMRVTALKGTQRIGINVRQPIEHGATVQVKFC